MATGMACAMYGAIRLAWADGLAHSDSVEKVQAALRLAPDDAGYWLHWAELEQASLATAAAFARAAVREAVRGTDGRLSTGAACCPGDTETHTASEQRFWVRLFRFDVSAACLFCNDGR